MSTNTPAFVMEAMQRAIKERCEPIVQKAIADCEQAIRASVHQAAVGIAKEIDYQFDRDKFVISVQFKEPRK